MKRLSSCPVAIWVAFCLLSNSARLEAGGGDAAIKLQAQLIWGTNEETSPDPKHKAIGPELAEKLKKSPYRWKNYFEVNRVVAEIPLNEKKPFKMSEQCEIDVKNVGGDHVEINMIGQGTPVSVHKEKVAPDWPLIFSGNSKGGNAWMVVVKKVEPSTVKVGTNSPKVDAAVPTGKPITPK